MDFTVERVSTSTFPSGRLCGTFMVRVEIDPEEPPSEVGITCVSIAMQSRVTKWWEAQVESTTEPDPQCSGPGYAHPPHGNCMGYGTDRT